MSFKEVVRYGQIDDSLLAPVKSSPPDAAAHLDAVPGGLLNAAMISKLFREVDFVSFTIPEKATFDASSNEALGAAIGTAISLQSVSFRDCSLKANINVAQVLSAALRDSFTLQRVDLTNSGIDVNGAKLLAKAIPGNRTVHDWIFASNPNIGDEGATFLAEALARSAAHRVCFRKCGITNVLKVAQSLLKISTLYSVDFRENPGYTTTKEALQFLTSQQEQLGRNAGLLFPRSQCLLSPFGGTSATGGAASDDDPASLNGTFTQSSLSAMMAAEKAEHEKQNNNNKGEGAPSANLDETQRTAEGAPENGGEGNAGEGQGGADGKHGSISRMSSARGQHNSMSREEFDRALRHWKRKPDIPTSGRKSSPSPATTNNNQQHPSLARRSGTAPSLEEVPMKEGAATRDILHGVHDWKQVKEHYNTFIHSPARASTSVEESFSQMRKRALSQPTYCLGKRIDHIQRSGLSPAFRGKPVITRVPSPKIIEQHAPWLNTPAPTPGSHTNIQTSHIGNKTIVPVAYDGKGNPIYTVIEDGGVTTYLNNDPREVGHYARQVGAKAIAPTEPWRRSNTQRDLRFALSEQHTGFVLKHAQAPDPGTYTAEDEWEKKARMLREKSKRCEKSSLGRPLFGHSAAPRASLGPAETHHRDNPGPGYYEIP